MNGLHGSDSNETAAREMAFFFPDLAVPAVPGGQKKKKKKTKRAAAKKEREPAAKIQRTLALIRPDAFRTHKDEILEKINAAGFKVALSKEMTLTREQAEDFYKEHAEEEYFEELITRMTSGPLLALGLAREDAVAGWREALGPKEVDKAKEEAPDSLRAQFSVEETPINQLHGSDSPETAEKELDFFFPMQQTVAVIKPDAMGTKEEIIQKIHEAGFRIAARQETTITREIAEEFYADQKDKDYFEDLVEHMCSGPTMFMVLSKEDAVANWRDTIGPTDPEAAKEQAPTSLRAEFGADPLKNAVHGSSNPDHARKGIEQIFGPLEFDKDGRVKGEAPEEEEEPTAVEEEPAEEEEEDEPEKPDKKSEADRRSEAGEEKEEAQKDEQEKGEQQKEDEQQESQQQQEQEQQQQQEEQQQEEQQEQQQEQQQQEEQKQEEQKQEQGGEQQAEEQGQTEQQAEEQKSEEQAQEEQKAKSPSPEPTGKSSPEVPSKSTPETEDKAESQQEAKPGSPKEDKPGAAKKKAEATEGQEGEAPPEEKPPEEE